ncbi:hypothetical protein [Rhodococcus sp. RS1C4]|nr:hypothetical protein [Rhodococcus sp. RS1C4]
MSVDRTPNQHRIHQLICNTPMQLLEIRQWIAPTHQRGAEDGSSHAKPSSRPPLAIDPIDALVAEEKQVLYWSNAYGFHKTWMLNGLQSYFRGTVGQRIQYLAQQDIPEWDCDNILERWQPIRALHEKRWPVADPRTWLSETEAIALVGRDKRTLRRWRASNPRIARIGPMGVEYDDHLLRAVWREQIKRAENSLAYARSRKAAA